MFHHLINNHVFFWFDLIKKNSFIYYLIDAFLTISFCNIPVISVDINKKKALNKIDNDVSFSFPVAINIKFTIAFLPSLRFYFPHDSMISITYIFSFEVFPFYFLLLLSSSFHIVVFIIIIHILWCSMITSFSKWLLQGL